MTDTDAEFRTAVAQVVRSMRRSAMGQSVERGAVQVWADRLEAALEGRRYDPWASAPPFANPESTERNTST